MKLLVSLENRFFKSPSGNYYSNNIFDYTVWKKYLTVFEEVIVCARVQEIKHEIADKLPANGLHVSFFELPMYIGLNQYLATHFALKKRMHQAVHEADAYMLRIPGRISSLLWYELINQNIPYGVEVVGSVEDSLDTCGINPLLKGYLKRTQSKLQKKQCQRSAVAAYVSQKYLQEIYPPGGWTTHYSSIDLPEDIILNKQQIENKKKSIQSAINQNRPFRICHAGTMATMYKAQDDLIQAVALSRHSNYDVELILMGDGKCKPFFEEKARQCGVADYVIFLGNVPAGKAVREQYDRCDLLVFPSLTEGLPRVPIEAMARGVTCIGTNVGGITELIPPHLLVEPKHPTELAEKIQYVIDNSQLLLKMVPVNISKAREYSLDVLTQRRNECYKTLMKETLNKKKLRSVSNAL